MQWHIPAVLERHFEYLDENSRYKTRFNDDKKPEDRKNTGRKNFRWGRVGLNPDRDTANTYSGEVKRRVVAGELLRLTAREGSAFCLSLTFSLCPQVGKHLHMLGYKIIHIKTGHNLKENIKKYKLTNC